uniref:PRELI/MSF1 domain-containing protein n=1 Tax=Anopheles maculatus TaxID=74869 RepID=A0A182S8C7_9DIPT
YFSLQSNDRLQLIGSPNVCYASEKSTVDPKERLMTLKTINLTFGSFLSVYETLSYVPHPTDPSKTLLKQEATVQVEGVPLNRYMEDVLTKNISTNAGKGRQGLEWVIGKLNAEVIYNKRCKAASAATSVASGGDDVPRTPDGGKGAAAGDAAGGAAPIPSGSSSFFGRYQEGQQTSNNSSFTVPSSTSKAKPAAAAAAKSGSHSNTMTRENSRKARATSAPTSSASAKAASSSSSSTSNIGDGS